MVAACLFAALAACGKKPPLPLARRHGRRQVSVRTRTRRAEREALDLAPASTSAASFDTYPRSPFRTQAKLGIGDAYLGEGRLDSLILAANEFREFLQFFPVDPRADYAQYRLGMALLKQMLGPERDQTATKEALTEFTKFQQMYPKSTYRPEVDKLYRETRDRLSDSEFLVGQFYYRIKLYVGAISRLQNLLIEDPAYTRKDQAYFLLGEIHYKALLIDQALPYYERLLTEFPSSKRAEETKKRLAEIKLKPKGGGVAEIKR